MKTTILILATILLLTNCSKNDDTATIPIDQLPAITTIGANTASCLIDGKVLIPKNGIQSIGGSKIFGLNFNAGNNFWPNKNDYFQLEIANKKDLNGAGLILYIRNIENGNFIINQSNGQLYEDGPNNNQIIVGIRENGIEKTYWSGANAGIIKITRSDLTTGVSIYSGTFNCLLYNKDNTSETIQITDGRFDINGITLNQ